MQEQCSGLPCPLPRDLPSPRIKPRPPTLEADSLASEPPGKPKNTGVGSLSLTQGILPTQESNHCLLKCRQILYQLSYQGIHKSTILQKNNKHKQTLIGNNFIISYCNVQIDNISEHWYNLEKRNPQKKGNSFEVSTHWNFQIQYNNTEVALEDIRIFRIGWVGTKPDIWNP